MDSCLDAFSQLPKAELSAGLALLVGEHVPLREKINGLLLVTQQMNNDENMAEKSVELKNKVVVFKGELDPHSEREEEILFPMLGAYIGTESGPVAMMEYEHAQAKALIGSFLENVEGKVLSNEAIKANSQLIVNAANLLKDHFSKEEFVLYPMAERMLSDDEKGKLLERVQKSINDRLTK